MKILIIENDDSLRDVISLVCQESLHSCYGVKTSQEAVEYLRRVRADIILLDIFRGREDAQFLITQLRNLYPDDPPKVIVMSTAIETEEIAREIHADCFLYKPFTAEMLEDLLAEKLENNS